MAAEHPDIQTRISSRSTHSRRAQLQGRWTRTQKFFHSPSMKLTNWCEVGRHPSCKRRPRLGHPTNRTTLGKATATRRPARCDRRCNRPGPCSSSPCSSGSPRDQCCSHPCSSSSSSSSSSTCSSTGRCSLPGRCSPRCTRTRTRTRTSTRSRSSSSSTAPRRCSAAPPLLPWLQPPRATRPSIPHTTCSPDRWPLPSAGGTPRPSKAARSTARWTRRRPPMRRGRTFR
mmetsp:Transcript_42944/g.87868  ORF Transcript_42944/g.87868 Transcript_42944/m.87868 type:complete len:229 (+) Transcript_42944:1973-2659(+)